MAEFALTLPLLVLLLFGIIQYGFIFGAYMTLRHGANVTARAVSVAGADTGSSNVTAIARSAITPGLNPNNLQTAQVASTTIGGKTAYNVTLTYSLPLIIKFVVPGATGNSKTLTAAAVYRKN